MISNWNNPFFTVKVYYDSCIEPRLYMFHDENDENVVAAIFYIPVTREMPMNDELIIKLVRT